MPSYSLSIARVCAIIAGILAVLALAHVLVPLRPVAAVCVLLLALAVLLPI